LNRCCRHTHQQVARTQYPRSLIFASITSRVPPGGICPTLLLRVSHTSLVAGNLRNAGGVVQDQEDRPGFGGSAAAALANQVMQEEQTRQEANLAEQFLLPDDLLPGMSGEAMGFGEALRQGGHTMVLLLTLLLVFESADQVAVQVLGPDIQKTLDISDTVLTGIASLGGVVLVLATLPLAWLADRFKRTRVVGFAAVVWAGFAALTGVAPNAFLMGLTRSGTGLGASATIPISPSIIADQYPLAARTRMLALESLGRPAGYVIGPFIAGFTASEAGGDEGWRWAFILGAMFPVVIGLLLLTQKDPKRGRFEQEAVLGEAVDVVDPPVRI
jgi:Major Facilitator Superfamily